MADGGTCEIWSDIDSACSAADPLRLTLPNSPVTERAPQSVAATCNQELLGICFVTPPTGPEPSIFGFAEFVTALALLIVVYTVSDVRYRFRIATAPIPLFRLTFVFIIIIGFGTLIGDVWFAERWPMPSFLIHQPIWQGLFGILFFSVVIVWTYFSFISPPIFGKFNYRQFTQQLYWLIVKGSDNDLPVIAGELARSATAIVEISGQTRRANESSAEDQARTPKPSAADYAYELLLLIGNRKLCRHVIASSPVTAIAFFEAMATSRKYHLPIAQFARNISTEAVINKDSILYHEDEGYNSGLIGYLRPFSKTIYGNYPLVEALASNLGSPLDVNYQIVWSW